MTASTPPNSRDAHTAAPKCDCPDFKGPVDTRHVCPVHGPLYADDGDAAREAAMSEVWKYVLDITDEQKVVMPQDADLLHVAEQYGKLALWARVVRSEPEVRRRILVRGTGHPIETQPYVGTAVTANGALVWHVFDGGEIE